MAAWSWATFCWSGAGLLRCCCCDRSLWWLWWGGALQQHYRLFFLLPSGRILKSMVVIFDGFHVAFKPRIWR